MTHRPRPLRLLTLALLIASAACSSKTPTGVENDDVRGTWSGTFSEFSLMGRTLSGDADWTFTRDTFEIIFFNPPAEQAERIEGKWKFADGKIALELTSSFPIDTDIGATDTLFVSILRDEMSLKSLSSASILLVKTRVASVGGGPPALVATTPRLPDPALIHARPLRRHAPSPVITRAAVRPTVPLQHSTA